MEQKIKSLIEKNYKHTTVESVSVVKSNLYPDDDCVILRCNTQTYRAPLIALRILNKYPSVRLVQFTGGWLEAVYTRESLKWAGYKVKEHLKRFEARGIVYCTDGEDVDLPANMTVECEDIEQVVDKISDKTGWLVETVGNIVEL